MVDLLIADALVVRGIRVEDILGPGARRPHGLTSFARVQGTAALRIAAELALDVAGSGPSGMVLGRGDTMPEGA
jgi:hypothetical protein